MNRQVSHARCAGSLLGIAFVFILFVLGASWVQAPVSAATFFSVSDGTLWNSSTAFPATINRAAIDTSQAFYTGGCKDLMLFVGFDGDTATATVQGAYSNSTTATWYSIGAITTLDGTPGTNAKQFYGPVLSAKPALPAGTLGTVTDFVVPPLPWIRLILNNTDKAGADTLRTVVARFICDK